MRDVLIRDGRVEAVRPNLKNSVNADEVLRLDGLLMLPGAIDPHVHFEEPGHVEREGYATGTQAAAAGGITTIFEHPLSDPPTTTAARYASKRDLVASHVYVDFGLWGAAVPGNLAEMRAMTHEGAGGFKAFMLELGARLSRAYRPISDRGDAGGGASRGQHAAPC